MSDNRVLLDSDAVIGWLVEDDQHHERAVQLFDYILSEKMQPVVTNLMISECATWLSARVSQEVARAFLQETEMLEIVYITEELHAETAAMFQQSQKHHTSFIDFANIVTMRHFRIPTIFAFDEVYRKTFGLKTLQEIAGY
jgi:predicted nucleic acid-binding protein